MHRILVLALFIPTFLLAEESQTQTACQSLLTSYAQIDIKAEQSEMVSGIKKGVVDVCRGLIKAEADLKAKTTELETVTKELTDLKEVKK